MAACPTTGRNSESHLLIYRAGRYSDVSGIQQPTQRTGAGFTEIPQPPCGRVCGVGGPGDKLYGGNLADCHGPGQRGSAEVPEHAKGAMRTKSGWIAQLDFFT